MNNVFLQLMRALASGYVERLLVLLGIGFGLFCMYLFVLALWAYSFYRLVEEPNAWGPIGLWVLGLMINLMLLSQTTEWLNKFTPSNLPSDSEAESIEPKA